MARRERFELPTPRFVVWCSIQLSYGRAMGLTGLGRSKGTYSRQRGGARIIPRISPRYLAPRARHSAARAEKSHAKIMYKSGLSPRNPLSKLQIRLGGEGKFIFSSPIAGLCRFQPNLNRNGGGECIVDQKVEFEHGAHKISRKYFSHHGTPRSGYRSRDVARWL